MGSVQKCHQRGSWETILLRTIRFGDAQTKPRFSRQDVGQEPHLLFSRAVVDQGRRADRVSTTQRPDDSQVTTPRDLIDDDQVVKPVPIFRFDVRGQSLVRGLDLLNGKRIYRYGHVAESCMIEDDVPRDDPLSFPVFAERCDTCRDVLPRLALQAPVAFCVIRAYVAGEPRRIRVRCGREGSSHGSRKYIMICSVDKDKLCLLW